MSPAFISTNGAERAWIILEKVSMWISQCPGAWGLTQRAAKKREAGKGAMILRHLGWT